MFYYLDIYDTPEEYAQALKSDDPCIRAVTLSFEDDEAKAIDVLRTAVACGKVAALRSSDTPF